MPADAAAISRLVQGVPALVSVDVGFNNFDEHAAVAVVKAAWRHDLMESLGLGSCKLNSSGAGYVAEYVAASKSLTALNLEYQVWSLGRRL